MDDTGQSKCTVSPTRWLGPLGWAVIVRWLWCDGERVKAGFSLSKRCVSQLLSSANRPSMEKRKKCIVPCKATHPHVGCSQLSRMRAVYICCWSFVKAARYSQEWLPVNHSTNQRAASTAVVSGLPWCTARQGYGYYPSRVRCYHLCRDCRHDELLTEYCRIQRMSYWTGLAMPNWEILGLQRC